MRPRPTLLVICLLVTALAAMPLSALDLRQPQLPSSSSWLEEMTGWMVSLWERVSGLAAETEPDRQDPKSLELPLPTSRGQQEGDTQPGGSCIDPNGVAGPGVSCS